MVFDIQAPPPKKKTVPFISNHISLVNIYSLKFHSYIHLITSISLDTLTRKFIDKLVVKTGFDGNKSLFINSALNSKSWMLNYTILCKYNNLSRRFKIHLMSSPYWWADYKRYKEGILKQIYSCCCGVVCYKKLQILTIEKSILK